MLRRVALLASTALAGCEPLEDLVGTIEDLTDPLVVLGVVTCVELPEGLDTAVVEGTELSPGTSFFAVVGDAAVIDATGDAEAAGLPGGSVRLEGVDALDLGDGTYTIAPGSLAYEDEETWTLDVDLAGDTGVAWVTLPPAASWEAPEVHPTYGDLVVDVGGEPFDSLLVTVADAETGEITWSNHPTTGSELMVVARTSGSLVVTVPGKLAFPYDGAFLVGVAGATHTRVDDLAGVNTALSAVVAGRTRVFVVETTSP